MSSSQPQTAQELDLPGLLERIHNNRPAMARLVAMLRDLLPGRVDALQVALASNDLPAAARAAHALRGSLSSFTTGPALQLAGDIERACIADDAGAARASVAALLPRLERVHAEVAEWLQREAS